MNDKMADPEVPLQAVTEDHGSHSSVAASISATDQTVVANTHPDGHADPVIPVAPDPVTHVATDSADIDHMDRPAVKELMQMIGAMTFVTLLIVVGWHAAHYSGAWPY
ncbi:hypothetical protein [Acetobacter oeni]|uniref:Uncharacterized protein n=1 Tax=Acetobacter oeni TaxID=304077 RepID=A0A511XK77_9PROT|nr:hypothetical protein [Acetobacter oeni]MBB3883891.1 hypothetical protein [Acetobacter oeni]NHO19815.1 hypothetical protein [Acetobacter oeni]GBR03463.1 hypothetical protein AA21952_1059 [Acetobacter oeni LMG 21952]GEN63356.1 hypothetical protein AOE01nite_15800 [Acetobacter oeni]